MFVEEEVKPCRVALELFRAIYIINTAEDAMVAWVVCPESKVHGANMGPIWDRRDPDGPYVGPMNSTIWLAINSQCVAM